MRVLVQFDEARETVRRSRAEVLGAAVSEGSADLSWQDSQTIDKHSVEGEIGVLAELCDFVVDVSQPLSTTTTDWRIRWLTVIVQLRISDRGKIAAALC